MHEHNLSIPAGERFQIGNRQATVMFTPGQTLASIALWVGDAVFIHAALFMPDGGFARRLSGR